MSAEAIRLALLASGLTTLLGTLFVLTGRPLIAAIRRDADRPNVGLAFFAGMALFLVAWRALTLAFPATFALFASLTALAGLAALAGFRDPGRLRHSARLVLPLLGAYAVTSVALMTYWLSFPGSPEYTWTDVGSLHAGRYVGVAAHVADHGVVPRVGQNYAQSLLAAAHLILGVDVPLMALASWLDFSVVMFAVAVYGVLRRHLTSAQAALGTGFVLFCNIALSLTFVMAIDSGSPLALTGYTDVFLGLATWLVFIDALGAWIAEGPSTPRILALALCGLVWPQCAPQNAILGVALVCGFAVTAARSFARTASAGVIVLAAVTLGALQGGMLTPKRLLDAVEIPGILAVPSEIKLYPGQPYISSYLNIPAGTPRWWDKLDAPRDTQLIDEARAAGRDELARSVAFRIERRFWDALRILFFPIAGAIGLGILAVRGSPDQRFRAIATWAVLAAGFAVCFPLGLGNSKFELTRFELPGILMGLIAFVLVLFQLTERWAPRIRSLVVAAVVVLGAIGPVVETVLFVGKRAVVPLLADGFRLRLEALSGSHADLLARYAAHPEPYGGTDR